MNRNFLLGEESAVGLIPGKANRFAPWHKKICPEVRRIPRTIDEMEEIGENDEHERRDSTAGMDAQGNDGSLEAAWNYIQGGGPANTECAQEEDRETARQIRLFREWAVQASRLINADSFKSLTLVSDSTSEHKIYFDPVRERAVKLTLARQFGWTPKLDCGRWTLGIAKPIDYLWRWRLFNRVFHDDVRLEGAMDSEAPTGIVGNHSESLSAVISQRWQRAADINSPTPSDLQVFALLRSLGFRRLPRSYHGWHRSGDGIVLLDARPDNFITTKDGIVPIDLLLTQLNHGA